MLGFLWFLFITKDADSLFNKVFCLLYKIVMVRLMVGIKQS